MNKRLIILLLGLCFILSACQLAKLDSGTSDRLVGVFLSTTRLELSEPLIVEITPEGASKDGDYKEISFEPFSGIPLYYYEFRNETEGLVRAFYGHGARFHDDTNLNDKTSKITMMVDIGLPKALNAPVYLYRLFQNQASALYLDPELHQMVITDGFSAQTVTIDDSSYSPLTGETVDLEVVLSFEQREPVKEVKLRYMDIADQLIEEVRFDSTNLPEQIDLPDGTAYLMMIESNGEERVIQRELIEAPEQYLTWPSYKYGFILDESVAIDWPK